MTNATKSQVLERIQQRLGQVTKLPGGNSLFAVGREAARIYFRYSKVHSGGRTFFGLREIDLSQLEGRNSFICFLVDDGSPPVFLPYADFEEVFRQANPARDGQYKVQIDAKRGPLELYIPKQGHFNVEAYVGLDVIERGVAASALRVARTFSHSQVQGLLAEIGQMKGHDVFVPASDEGRLQWTVPGRFRIRRSLPSELGEIGHLVSEIDVVWSTPGKGTLEGLFEVEHTTTVYSALLRFNDVLLADSRVSRFSVVSDESRRSLFARQLYRPTFKRSGLAEVTSFLEYSNVFDWHSRLSKRGETSVGGGRNGKG